MHATADETIAVYCSDTDATDDGVNFAILAEPRDRIPIRIRGEVGNGSFRIGLSRIVVTLPIA